MLVAFSMVSLERFIDTHAALRLRALGDERQEKISTGIDTSIGGYEITVRTNNELAIGVWGG
jgi:ABC-type uncharacterized transport system permease subunit